jgi:polysaccharide export outer membrane protein
MKKFVIPAASVFAAVILACTLISHPVRAQDKVPRELMDFVTDARALGLSDADIKKSAVNAGWKPAVVEQAFAPAAGAVKPEMAGAMDKTRGVPLNYRIGPGDVLQISVWKEPEASVPDVTVRTDGKISVPLIKEVTADGLTPIELEKHLAERFGAYIKNAEVTVVVRQVRSKKIYVVGAVRREGPVAIESPMTILQTLVAAGGLTDYAKTKKIYLLRTVNGRQTRFPFDYNAVIRGERVEQNIQIMPDDTIVVPH